MTGRNVTMPNRNRIFSHANFIEDCVNNKYILVIGSEAVLDKENEINRIFNGDSSKKLFHLAKQLSRGDGIIIADGINDFMQLPSSIDLREYVLAICNDAYKEFLMESFDEDFEPTLFELLSTKCFRFVLTTTIDPYVEFAMKKIWGERLKIKSIYGNGEYKDFLRSISLNEFDEIEPTLYYVFGRPDESAIDSNHFVLSENDAMCIVKKWFSEERPKKVLEYINSSDKRILSIGCKFDNWLFRFFWFILTGSTNNLTHGQVALEKFTKEDCKLKEYLDKQRIFCFEDSRKFMKKTVKSLNENMDLGIKNSRRQGEIFISYAHEDKYIALPLFNWLVQKGFNVWIDERKLETSNVYRHRIETAINQCRIFMPILSSQVKYDLEHPVADNEKRFYMQEWDMAQRRYDDSQRLDGNNDFKIFPFVVGDYDVGSKYHKKTVACIQNVTAKSQQHEQVYIRNKESQNSLVDLLRKLL